MVKNLLLLAVLFYAFITNPTTNDLISYLEKTTGFEQKISENTDSPAAAMIANGLVKSFVGAAIQRDNYYLFSIYQIPMSDVKVIGIFKHFYKI